MATVPDSHVIALGGLTNRSEGEGETRVPFLGSIPLLGALFRRRANESKKRELLIFVTPTIVEDRPLL